MDVWVANTTKQNFEFNYRMPESTRIHSTKIPIGGQVRIHKAGLSQPEVDAIVEQIERIGGIRSDSVERTKAFIGLAYSIDKPVRPAAIETAVDHNDDVLTERGHENRKAAAVAIHENLSAADRDPRNLSESSVEIIEDVKRGEDPGIRETIEVVREGDNPAPSKRGRPRKGR